VLMFMYPLHLLGAEKAPCLLSRPYRHAAVKAPPDVAFKTQNDRRIQTSSRAEVLSHPWPDGPAVSRPILLRHIHHMPDLLGHPVSGPGLTSFVLSDTIVVVLFVRLRMVQNLMYFWAASTAFRHTRCALRPISRGCSRFLAAG
jgi:hypothetical protein